MFYIKNIILIITIAVTFAISFNSHYANAQEEISFATKIKNWKNLQNEINKALSNKSNVITKDDIKSYKQTLREFRLDLLEQTSILREKLAAQKELATALGEAPEDETAEEESIKKQRQTINDDLLAIDADIKQVNLIVAQIDELISTLDSYEYKKSKAKLLAKTNISFNIATIGKFNRELTQAVGDFISRIDLLYFLAFFLIITIIIRPLTSYFNNFAEQAKNINLLKPFSKSRLLAISVIAYITFTLRFKLLDLSYYPTVDIILNIILSISLSCILFFALGKIEFTVPEHNADLLGEKRQGYYWLWNLISRLARLVLLILPFAAIYGYVNLAQYVSFNILITVVAAVLFFTIRSLVVFANTKLTHKKENEDELSPLAITIIEPIIALICMMTVMFFWGMTSEDFKTLIDQYRHGITVGEVTIDFSVVISAIGFFFALYYVTKAIQWFLSSRVFPYTDLDNGVRDAVITIGGYVGVTIALLSGVSVLGLDMSNLAIVAGALSVGIGFGLQTIFSNFVSGLILLFERPVKVGDWVVVGGQEGIIKKIRVRSTEITTFYNASIIVPNSELISNTVTNWTLRDKVGRIDVCIGVSYNSDTEQVRQVLLDVVKSNTQVRNYPQPQVLFMNFGESSLDFELRCFIRNVPERFMVKSELRFAIHKAFKEHNIEIPFPQRDLHLVSSNGLNMNNEKKEEKGKSDDIEE